MTKEQLIEGFQAKGYIPTADENPVANGRKSITRAMFAGLEFCLIVAVLAIGPLVLAPSSHAAPQSKPESPGTQKNAQSVSTPKPTANPKAEGTAQQITPPDLNLPKGPQDEEITNETPKLPKPTVVP